MSDAEEKLIERFVPESLRNLYYDRVQARKDKDFVKSDQIRRLLVLSGVDMDALDKERRLQNPLKS